MKNFLSKYPFHTLFIGTYPVLALYNHNMGEVPFFATLRVMIFSLTIVALVYFLVFIFRKKSEKLAVICTISLLFFYLYGHVYNSVYDVLITALHKRVHTLFISFWVILFLLACLGVTRLSKISNLNIFLNVSSFILITLPMISIFSYHLSYWRLVKKPDVDPFQVQTLSPERTSPNVYYIVVDSYGREDLLIDAYAFDNTKFIMELEQMGFVVPSCTQSNYAMTVLSLYSSLNFNYLESYDSSLLGESSVSYLEPYIKQSAVRQFFENFGYQTVTMKTVYPYLDITDSSYYYDYFKDGSQLGSIESLNFQYLFMMTTAFRPIYEYFEFHSVEMPSSLAWILPDLNLLDNRNYKQYQQNLYLLDALENDIPKIQARKFVFAHLFITHQPFSFTPEGLFRWPVEETDTGYRDQVLYLNKRLIDILTSILAEEETPPIIIIQGDHSYIQSDRRVQILNAYYLPGRGISSIYPEITPVNTFRVILNEYFDGSYELLDDISYYSIEDAPFDFTIVPTTCVNP